MKSCQPYKERFINRNHSIPNHIKANHPLLSKHDTERKMIEENRKLKATRAKKQQKVNELYVRNKENLSNNMELETITPSFQNIKQALHDTANEK